MNEHNIFGRGSRWDLLEELALQPRLQGWGKNHLGGEEDRAAKQGKRGREDLRMGEGTWEDREPVGRNSCLPVSPATEIFPGPTKQEFRHLIPGHLACAGGGYLPDVQVLRL